MSGLCATVSFLSAVALMWLVLLGVVEGNGRAAVAFLFFMAFAALLALARAGAASRRQDEK